MRKLQTEITNLSYVLTGTVSRKYGPCGKMTCRCAKGKEHWHGPYYVWTRKEHGKTITKTLSPKQAQFCRSAITNTRKLNDLITRWRAESLNTLVDI